MPSISNKGQRMPESPIRKLAPFAQEAAAKGKTVYQLNIGQPDILTPDKAMNAVKIMTDKVLEYSPSDGFPSLKAKLSDYYKNNGIDVEANELLVTTGGSEAILFALNSIMDADNEIIIPEPFYANYNGFAISAGVNVIPVNSSIENNFSLPPVEEFEKLINTRTKAILICNPGNPTGYLYSKDELKKLKEICLRNDLFLIADEVYREFTYGDFVHTSILSLDGLENNAIVIDSVSKRYSMCGARIGCIVSKNKEVIKTALKYAQARLSPPTFAQIATEAALDTDEDYIHNVIAEYCERRDILVDGLNQIEGVICPKPKGAFYAIAQLPVDSSEKFAQWLLSDFELNKKTVMVAPAQGFYSTTGLGEKQVRLAYVLEKEKLVESVEILKQALKAYPGKL